MKQRSFFRPAAFLLSLLLFCSVLGSTGCVSILKDVLTNGADTAQTESDPDGILIAPPPEKPKEENPVIAGLTPVKKEDYHGRKSLAAMPRASVLLDTYDRLAAGAEKMEKNILLYDGKNTISMSEFETVLSYYRADYPQHFWLGNSYSFTTDQAETEIYAVQPDYALQSSELSQAKARWETAVKKLLERISVSGSEYDREKEIHDRLAEQVVYQESANCHTAYGALVEGKAVCEGYARAFQYLLNRVGIRCLYVTGSSNNPGSGKPEAHAWNMAKINGSWYHVDVTWNDQEDATYYAYLNIMDKMLAEDHIIDEDNYTLPTCNATAENYFKKSGTWFNNYTVGRIAACLKQSKLTARLYIGGGNTVDAFCEWLEQNIMAIAAQCGVTGGFSYQYSSLGREMLITITPE